MMPSIRKFFTLSLVLAGLSTGILVALADGAEAKGGSMEFTKPDVVLAGETSSAAQSEIRGFGLVAAKGGVAS